MMGGLTKNVRVRFAPSPTGFLHIGGVRTILFNWLFVRQHQGKFILRIEDTDKERSKPEYEKDILESISWLGLNWDEGPISRNYADLTRTNAEIGNSIGGYGPYRQSERTDIYEKYLNKLLDGGKAYFCFCAKEQLEIDRQAMLAQGLAPKYSGRCRTIRKEEIERKMTSGESAVIRFKMPETEVEFTDLIRGKIKFDTSLIGDAVIAKNVREPLYNFTVVVDDALMEISHVIRGEEHLPNTPKQILLGQALGLHEPKYGHLPLILTPDRKKMSKRFMDVSVKEYRAEGYLSEAIVNFVALLGWHPQDDREIFSKEELIKEFDVRRVQKAGAVFSIEKLDWLNGEYIRKTDIKKLCKRVKDFIPSKWAEDEALLLKALGIEKARMNRLTDFKQLAEFFFDLPNYDKNLLIWPRGASVEEKGKDIRGNLSESLKVLQKIADFTKENLENAVLPLAEVWGRGEVLWPLRSAVSGREASPGPFEIMEVLGKDESLRRIEAAMEKLID